MTIDGTSPVSRRAAVGATATVALGGAASLAHASAQGSEPMKKQELENPADRYPKPPYKKQSQQWPGLVSQMGSNNPRSSRLRRCRRGVGRN
jgi:hypothetical protein